MRLDGLDLNLLVLLDALLTSRSVTVAAELIGLSQPATSAALGRLREHFGDDLFVSRNRAFVPTPFAQALQGPVRDLIGQARAVVNASAVFDPARTRRQFTIVASEGIAALAISALAQRFADLACSASIRWLSNNTSSIELFRRGGADLLLLREGQFTRGFRSRPLYRENFCCIAADDGPPRTKRLSLAAFRTRTHVAVDTGEPGMGLVHQRLADLGIERDVRLIVGNYGLVPPAILGTRHVAIVPRRFAESLRQRQPVTIWPLPFEMATFAQCAHWNAYTDTDAGIRWLVAQLAEALAPPRRNGE